MLKYNRKTRWALKWHSKKPKLPSILDSFKNMCIDQGHNNVHVTMKLIDISYPMRMHSRSYESNLPRLRYIKNKYSSIYYEAYTLDPIPMSAMVKKSKIYKDNR